MKFAVTTCLAIWALITFADAAGVGVHLTVLDRLRRYLPADLEDYYEYTLAGAFFPDAFYSCMDLSEAAEETHWPPFMKTAIDHWTEKYGPLDISPVSESLDNVTQSQLIKVSGEKSMDWLSQTTNKVRKLLEPKRRSTNDDKNALRAFLYGVLTHEVADVSWHSLGIKQGLLRYMANREFDADVDAAHFILDTGGDMIFVRRLLLSEENSDYMRRDWKYPKQDIVEIFDKMGYTLHSPQLEYCMFRGKAAARAELQIAPVAFYSYAQKSPILFNKLEDYYLGGMTEMTMSTRHCIYNLNDWFQHGTPKTDAWSLCEIFYGVADKGPEPGQYRSLSAANRAHSHPHELENLHNDRHPISHAVATWQFPFKSLVKFSNPLKAHPQASQQPMIISTNSFQAQLGQSITIGDFLKHGNNSIAFGCPYETENHNGQDLPIGSVYVADLVELMTDRDPSDYEIIKSVVNQPKKLAPRLLSPLSRDQTYTLDKRFGSKSVKINILGEDLLVISSPGSSKISLFHKGKEVVQLVLTSSVSLYGDSGVKLIGEQLLSGDFGLDGLEGLVIGAHYSDVGKIEQKGRVFYLDGNSLKEIVGTVLAMEAKKSQSLPILFRLDSVANSIIDLPSLEPDTHSNGTYASFGSKLARVGRDTLLVGAEGLGKVYGFRYIRNKFEPAFNLTTDDPSFRSTFGGSLLAGTSSGWIAVGDSTQNSPKAQAGAIFLYKLEDGQPRFQKKIDLGESAVAFDRFGHEGIFYDDTLLVVSPFAHNEQGKVWSISLQDSSVQELVSSGPPPYVTGFGASIAVTELNDDEKVVFIGMPFYNRLTGGVAVYKFDEF